MECSIEERFEAMRTLIRAGMVTFEELSENIRRSQVAFMEYQKRASLQK